MKAERGCEPLRCGPWPRDEEDEDSNSRIAEVGAPAPAVDKLHPRPAGEEQEVVEGAEGRKSGRSENCDLGFPIGVTRVQATSLRPAGLRDQW